MKKKILQQLIITILLFISGALFSQSPSTIIWQGTLSDENGEHIKNEVCDIEFSIINSDDKELFKLESSIITNGQGMFLFPAENLPEIFSSYGNPELATIKLTIVPAEGASWMQEDKFSISYDLDKNGPEDYIISRRIDSRQMNFSYEMPVWLFDDIYPFEYLSSRFMISFSDEITDIDSIILICEDMNAGDDQMIESAPPPSKRGVKGGFAVGGYKKK